MFWKLKYSVQLQKFSYASFLNIGKFRAALTEQVTLGRRSNWRYVLIYISSLDLHICRWSKKTKSGSASCQHHEIRKPILPTKMICHCQNWHHPHPLTHRCFPVTGKKGAASWNHLPTVSPLSLIQILSFEKPRIVFYINHIEAKGSVLARGWILAVS